MLIQKRSDFFKDQKTQEGLASVISSGLVSTKCGIVPSFFLISSSHLTSPPSSLQWGLLPGHHHRHGAHHEHVHRGAVRRHCHGESETFPPPSMFSSYTEPQRANAIQMRFTARRGLWPPVRSHTGLAGHRCSKLHLFALAFAQRLLACFHKQPHQQRNNLLPPRRRFDTRVGARRLSQASSDISEMADRVHGRIKAAAFKLNCIYIFMKRDQLFRMQADRSVAARPSSVLLPGGRLHRRGSGLRCQTIKWLSAQRHHGQMFIPREPLGFPSVWTAARLLPDVCLPRCSQTADGLN